MIDLEAFTTALVGFLVTVDPLGVVPIFLAITAGAGPSHRRAMANKGMLVGGVALLGFALAGDAVLVTLGISMPAFRISGGIFLFLLALEMVFERRTQRRNGTASSAVEEGPELDVSVFPLAVPLIAGPAAITAAILASNTHGTTLVTQASVVLALLTALALTWLALILCDLIEKLLGATLIGVVSRLLGLLLGALAIQYVIDGVQMVLRGP